MNSALFFILITPLALVSALPELDWWQKTLFYQIYPRSFMDSDGDGAGDLKGVTSKLHHLKEAGIGATWLSPIFKSPMRDFRYDISDFYAIHEEYGTMEDFENLLDKAKELDIKIILDFVPNHTSNESEWFRRSADRDPRYRDWYVWAEGRRDDAGVLRPTTNWVSMFRKSAWEYKAERDAFYLHQFVIGQPDLNYRNPEVVAEMKRVQNVAEYACSGFNELVPLNVLRFWLEKGVAGFRVDAVPFLFEAPSAPDGSLPDEPPRADPGGRGPDDYEYYEHPHTRDQPDTYDMVYQWRAVLDEFSARDNFTRVMMAEAYADTDLVMEYYGGGARAGAQIPFNFLLLENLKANFTAAELKAAIDRWIDNMPDGRTSNWVLGNHDQHRIASRYGPGRVDAINMMLLLLPGIGVTYNGEEIGMVDGYISWKDTVDPAACNTDDPVNYVTSSRDPARTPFQWSAAKNAGFSTASTTWLPVAKGFEQLNLEAQKAASRSHFKVYQECTKLRQEIVFRHGSLDTMAFNDSVFAFVRSLAGEPSHVVVMNFFGAPDTVDLTSLVFTADLEVLITDIASNKTVGQIVKARTLELNPHEALVLQEFQDVTNV